MVLNFLIINFFNIVLVKVLLNIENLCRVSSTKWCCGEDEQNVVGEGSMYAKPSQIGEAILGRSDGYDMLFDQPFTSYRLKIQITIRSMVQHSGKLF